MVISPKWQYAFVSTVKGGTNSLYEVLTSSYDGHRYGDFHCCDVSEIPSDWLLFTTCRNPYTRAVSIWWSTCMRGKDRYQFRQMCENPDSFEAFARWAASVQPHLGDMSSSQQQLLMTQSARHGDINFSTILRMEHLERDFAQLPFVMGRGGKLPQLNPTVGQRDGAHTYLTEEAALAVQKWMGVDFDRYGYSREIAKIETLEASPQR
ncbi:sulfotransferase family 2 domain-containing protein [Rubinisphaera margarita]|uniref:sulfotransferase family 2 domain-containing protein n=1 Tax=Rubinisphaera margarita TaxID=2909586 RepID=UPI001EE7A9DA|nr:sulfotransferase family 2 domain-containing protein [Rubinisphaera margarita]MCG6155150.1 sulfotransferase family 2 domain-containing protein [Rubinisphaera margarita]